MNIWYSYKGKKYPGDNPPYYDLAGVEWYGKLRQDLPLIKERLLTFLTVDGLDIKEYFNRSMVEGTRWEAISFLFWKVRNEDVIKKGAGVFQYFEHIPGVVSVSVSILQPHTRIKGHYGDTDAIYRMHIPIFIPASLPDCGLTVGGVTRPWTDNELIVFCDAHFHEAWNMSDVPRIILIVDVMKPEFISQTNNVCANVLSSLKYQHFAGKHPIVRKLPGWGKDLTRRLLKRFYPVAILRQ